MSITRQSRQARPGVIASLAAGGVVAAALAAVVFATPGSGVVGTVMGRAGFADTGDIKLKLRDESEVIHVTQAGDTVVQKLIVAPGGHTGWHSHHGPAIAVVQNGELTVYSSEDCTGRPYGAGQAFVDSGQGHVHIARNLTSQETEVWVTYLDVPPGESVRLDAADPGTCAF
jgi:quercetin dioxygenase-like cupin family protein